MPSVGWRWLFCVRRHVVRNCDHTLSTSHSPPPKKERLIAGYVVRHVEFAIKVGLNRGTSLLFIYCLYTELHEDGMALDAGLRYSFEGLCFYLPLDEFRYETGRT